MNKEKLFHIGAMEKCFDRNSKNPGNVRYVSGIFRLPEILNISITVGKNKSYSIISDSLLLIPAFS